MSGIDSVQGPIEEVLHLNTTTDATDVKFNTVIGCIEGIIMDDKFLNLHSNFMEKHWQEFDDTEENKFIYSDIFKKYTEVIEKYIEEQLVNEIKDFNMFEFEKDLEKRHNDLEGEVFEILSTFTNFLEFKTMFLDYKAMKEGKHVDFSKDFAITKYKIEDS